MILIGVSFCLFNIFVAANAGGPTLVLLDNLAIKETHSIFFKHLQGRSKLFYQYQFLIDMFIMFIYCF